jgi:hypothetical protein
VSLWLTPLTFTQANAALISEHAFTGDVEVFDILFSSFDGEALDENLLDELVFFFALLQLAVECRWKGN